MSEPLTDLSKANKNRFNKWKRKHQKTTLFAPTHYQSYCAGQDSCKAEIAEWQELDERGKRVMEEQAAEIDRLTAERDEKIAAAEAEALERVIGVIRESWIEKPVMPQSWHAVKSNIEGAIRGKLLTPGQSSALEHERAEARNREQAAMLNAIFVISTGHAPDLLPEMTLEAVKTKYPALCELMERATAPLEAELARMSKTIDTQDAEIEGLRIELARLRKGIEELIKGWPRGNYDKCVDRLESLLNPPAETKGGGA